MGRSQPANPPSVGRPREFDIDEALDKAMGAFWLHGYEATSLCDLMEATGLQKGSIYKAFGDKRSLFIQALRRYLDQGVGRVGEVLGAGRTPTDGLRKWLEMSLGVCSGGKRGCFAVNAVVELAPHDAEVRRILDRHFAKITSMVEEVIERAQQSGELRGDIDAGHAAEFLSVFIAGLAADSKVSRDTGKSKRLVKHALRVLQT